MTSLMPASAGCEVCGFERHTSDLARAFLPGGETAIWVCRDHHVCARNIEAAHEAANENARPRGLMMAAEQAGEQGPHRRLGLFHDRMRQLRAEHGITEET